MSKVVKNPQNVIAVIKEKRTTIISIAVIAILCIVVILTVQRAMNYNSLKKEYDELQTTVSKQTKELEKFNGIQEQLTHAEEQVKLYKESTNALTQQVSDLNAVKEELNSQIEELLNVEETVPVVTRSVLEERITSLSELVTKQYWYRNATQKDDDKTWLWGWTMPFSDTSLLATYDGVITTSIDIKEIKFSVAERAKTITVTMPHSKIFDHNIPQETINVLQHKDNLFNKVTFNDYNKFISAEKDVMEQQAIERGLLTEADEEAKKVVEAFLKTIPGIEAYTIKFK